LVIGLNRALFVRIDSIQEDIAMAEVNEKYRNEIYKQFDYLATWLPNNQLQLGDVGIQKGSVFNKIASLDELEIPFTKEIGITPIDFVFTSQSEIKVEPKIDLNVGITGLPQVVKAGVDISFLQKGAYYFEAKNCLQHQITNKLKLNRAIIKLIAKKIWKPEWSYIDTIVNANCATIIVSISSNANLVLSAKTPIGPGNLANLDAGLSIYSQKGEVISFLAAKGLTPLFKATKINTTSFTLFKKSPTYKVLVREPLGIDLSSTMINDNVFVSVSPPDISQTKI
jgi:hypothetical protein